ncbi:hypothetical protein [Tropicimonas marinistellae]|uniref:hypothetical protein n=1 Tax=Tropicimonas marinistellae TaxID=1739787 RepID=UPI00082E572D|nr:hypothetical protein [Tropicimonas marinistellae]
MTDRTHATILARADWLETELQRTDGLSHATPDDAEKIRNVIEEIADKIARMDGTSLALGRGTERLRMHGITVTSTAGPLNLFRAWVRKARAVTGVPEDAAQPSEGEA